MACLHRASHRGDAQNDIDIGSLAKRKDDCHSRLSEATQWASNPQPIWERSHQAFGMLCQPRIDIATHTSSHTRRTYQ
eukprot:scaffold122744_cov35-Tisochrysis_lutea.AAC.1